MPAPTGRGLDGRLVSSRMFSEEGGESWGHLAGAVGGDDAPKRVGDGRRRSRTCCVRDVFGALLIRGEKAVFGIGDPEAAQDLL